MNTSSLRALRASYVALLALAGASLLPLLASAHEVYVLPHDAVLTALATPRFSEWAVLLGDIHRFMFWAFVGVSLVLFVFILSISRTLERLLDPLCMSMRTYAPVVSRITIGISFLAAAYFGALFGPELPLVENFGTFAPLVTGVLVLIGICITLGIYARVAALVALFLFGVAILRHGTYMLTYTSYLGEIAVLLILGAHRIGLHTKSSLPRWLRTVEKKLAPYSFFILRVSFGMSLLYAAFYAKFLHNNLALMVASMPLGHAAALSSVLGFEPHFLVLGAGLVELVIGLFFLLGIEIRFTALFVEFWLFLSLLYFGESVWPHLILIGIPIAFFMYGYDTTSIEGFFFKRGRREPIL